MKLFDFYFKPSSSASFTGLTSAQKLIKKNESKNFKDWLINQESYTLHRPLLKKFKRQKVIVNGIDDLWQADLVDVSNISRENNGYKYLLTVIDVFSKKAWVEPIKDKTSESILKALKIIIKSRKPKKLQCDKGSEFLNKLVQKYLKDEQIKFYTTNSELKACVVERFNRTIKEKMWRYFSYKNNYRYVDILSDLVESYNNTYHRSIKTKPNLVTKEIESQVWKTLYGYDKTIGDDSIINPKYKKGDKVRISKNKGIFEKGYTPNWTREIFIIDKLILQNPPVYIIKDLNNEEIAGKFYEQELQKVNNKDEVYSIDKIIRKRKKNNQIEYFVSWLGYPKSFNSWITEQDLVQK